MCSQFRKWLQYEVLHQNNRHDGHWWHAEQSQTDTIQSAADAAIQWRQHHLLLLLLLNQPIYLSTAHSRLGQVSWMSPTELLEIAGTRFYTGFFCLKARKGQDKTCKLTWRQNRAEATTQYWPLMRFQNKVTAVFELRLAMHHLVTWTMLK